MRPSPWHSSLRKILAQEGLSSPLSLRRDYGLEDLPTKVAKDSLDQVRKLRILADPARNPNKNEAAAAARAADAMMARLTGGKPPPEASLETAQWKRGDVLGWFMDTGRTPMYVQYESPHATMMGVHQLEVNWLKHEYKQIDKGAELLSAHKKAVRAHAFAHKHPGMAEKAWISSAEAGFKLNHPKAPAYTRWGDT